MKESTEAASWWKEAVVYQIYPRSFQDTDGDGVGDLPGVLDRLDHLESLGVDAIWLSPFYPSPMADFGYDVADYTGVDPLFGTVEDFDRLLAAAHRRGIRVIVDLVPNHTSDEHPWFVESRSSRRSPKRDWYVWADGPDLPNNWLSVFGGPAWEWDEGTGQYYLHSFLAGQPDLNWRNPEVRNAMSDVMRWWLDRGVDGFRIDVALFIMKDPDLRDNPLVDAASGDFKSMGEYDRQLHVHDQAHPDVHEAFREIRRVLNEYQPERVSIGEIHVFDPEQWASYYGANDELHMPFNFSLLYADWEAGNIRRIVDSFDAVTVGDRWPNWVLGNHDETRLVTRIGERAARAAAVMLLTLRGTPTIYYGDELGLAEADVPPGRQVDPWGLRVPGLGRDGCRTPMPWDDTPGAGFTRGEPWLPLGADTSERNVVAQREDPESSLNLYRRLLACRRSSSALRLGSYESFDAGEEVFAYRRTDGDESVTVAIAFGQPQLAEVGPGRILLSSDSVERGDEIVDGTVALAADEAVVIVPI